MLQTGAARQLPGWPSDEEAVAAARSMTQQLAAEKLAARIAELEQLPDHLSQVSLCESTALVYPHQELECAQTSVRQWQPLSRSQNAFENLSCKRIRAAWLSGSGSTWCSIVT